MLRVTSVKPLDNLSVEVTLSNGKSGTFSVRPYLISPYFKELENPAYFRQVAISFGCIGWSRYNREQDLGPDTIEADLEELVGV
jgi:hypothetical protein